MTNVRWLLPLTAVLCGLPSLTIKRAWPKDHATSFLDRCFATTGPTLWNSLPEQLRQLDITFRQLK